MSYYFVRVFLERYVDGNLLLKLIRLVKYIQDLYVDNYRILMKLKV